MNIPYEIGDIYSNQNIKYKISGITIKADNSIKIRLSPCCANSPHFGVFEEKEKDFINNYIKEDLNEN